MGSSDPAYIEQAAERKCLQQEPLLRNPADVGKASGTSGRILHSHLREAVGKVFNLKGVLQ